MSYGLKRVLVVDDEELGRTNLRYALRAHADWVLAGECSDSVAVRAFLKVQCVDLILLDIHMPSESGLQLARELSLQAAPPLIVFVTAHDAHAIEAFSVHALDYLLKPIDDGDLARALSRASALCEQRQLAAHANTLREWAAGPAYLNQLNVRSAGRIECIQLEDVMWIEAAGNYVELHTTRRRILHRVPISTLERHLNPACFVRVHRSALVRIAQVAEMRTGPGGIRTLLLRSGSEVPLSDRYIDKVRAALDVNSMS